MSTIDFSIVIIYLAGIIGIGLYFQRKAAGSIDAYFLGNRKMPWWALGMSGMSSNLDISGTMINTAFIFALGAAGFFIEIRGGVTLIMAFLMIFQGKWNRRSLVMTQAEWMTFRFGKGRQGDIARILSAVSTIITTIAIITYFAIGAGKFVGEFLGIPAFWGLSSEFWAATLMIILAMIYTVASGLYGVVWTDVFQSFLIFGTIMYITILAFVSFDLPQTFEISVPMRDGTFMALETTRDAWTSLMPTWALQMPEASLYSIYNLFGIVILFYLLKVILEGSGGGGQYMIQRYFAARSDREAGLLSLLWTFLLTFRWPFIAAIATMGVVLGSQQGVIQDPETVLPVVINELVPIGIKGLLVAGLMAAGMSTFDSVVNAGAAYWVKDIYQAFINPEANEKQLMQHGRWSAVIMVILGLGFMLFIRNINDIWGWITASLGAGLLIPQLCRWYWWRMNGAGFAAGMFVGMVTAIVQRLLLPDVPEYYAFIIVTIASIIGIVVGTLTTEPTSREVLTDFYKRTRPFGFWGPIRSKLSAESIKKINSENRRDIISTFFAVPWQVILFLTAMAIVFKRWDQFVWLFAALIILSVLLYFNWFRHLSSEVNVEESDPIGGRSS